MGSCRGYPGGELGLGPDECTIPIDERRVLKVFEDTVAYPGKRWFQPDEGAEYWEECIESSM